MPDRIQAAVQVRQAALADADAVAALFDGYRQFYGQAPDLPLAQAFVVERMTRMESVILLADDQNRQAVGFTQLYPSFSSVNACRIWILNDLFVLPSMRGRRVGHALLAAARAHAVATGTKRLVLSTGRDNPAQKLYESIGYQLDEAFHHYSLKLD